MKPLVLLSLFLLTACASEKTIPVPDRPKPPANAVIACPDLTPLQSATGADVLKKIVEISKQYYACQRRHKALIQAW